LREVLLRARRRWAKALAALVSRETCKGFDYLGGVKKALGPSKGVSKPSFFEDLSQLGVDEVEIKGS